MRWKRSIDLTHVWDIKQTATNEQTRKTRHQYEGYLRGKWEGEDKKENVEED